MNAGINSPVLLFDGVCNLCNASVQWVLKHDKKAVFRFAALQSPAGQSLLRNAGLSAEDFDTVVLVDGARVFTRSDAALEIVRRIGGLWSWLAVFRFVPRPVRDAVYDWIARRRYRWFGRTESCMIPRPEWSNRFI